MQGTEKQIEWAEQIKSQFLKKLERGQKVKGFDPLYSEEEYNNIVKAAESKTDASWWIDRRLDGVSRMADNVLGRPAITNSVF